jgi:glycosyltransferase involved in cell wall biosynthesis
VNVCQVVPRYPPRTGGVETHVREVSERLVARGHDVTVVTADAGGDVSRRETRNGVRVRRRRGVAPGGAFHVAPGVARAVRAVDADVVHAHNYHSLPLLFAAAAAGDARFVATPHYHGGSASDLRDRLLTLYRPLGRWALRRADAVVAVSDWEREQLRADFGVAATVVPNGIEVERFRDADPRTHDRPYLLTVGRLEAYKGVQHAIRALPALPDYDLLVAGSGDYGDRLREVARETDVAERVEFLGYVADADLPAVYAGAAAFVTMSGFEAYGLTVGEALAAGTPAVVREAGALVDWAAREDCVGVAGTDPDDVASAVERTVGLSPDPDTLPTWDDVVDELEALYRAQT